MRLFTVVVAAALALSATATEATVLFDSGHTSVTALNPDDYEYFPCDDEGVCTDVEYQKIVASKFHLATGGHVTALSFAVAGEIDGTSYEIVADEAGRVPASFGDGSGLWTSAMGTLAATALTDPPYPSQGYRYDYSGFGVTLAAGDYWFVAHPHYPHFDREIVYAGTGTSANAERVETIVGDGPNYGPIYGTGPQVGLRLEGVAVVPEPASWALMLGGFGIAGAGLRLRRRQTAG